MEMKVWVKFDPVWLRKSMAKSHSNVDWNNFFDIIFDPHWMFFFRTGHSKIVALLLDRNADFASSDSNGATPLHYAAQNNFAVSEIK